MIPVICCRFGCQWFLFGPYESPSAFNAIF
jgi:hypothetical protein